MTLDLLPVLGVVAPVVLALLAGLGWIVRGRRSGPSTPAQPLPIVAEIEGAHVRQVERIEADAREVGR